MSRIARRKRAEKKNPLVLTLGWFCRFWEGGHTDLSVLTDRQTNVITI
jgi:hypothetical protein